MPTLEGVKANTGAYPKQALADAGFDSGRNLHELETRQMDGYIPDGAEANIGKDLKVILTCTARAISDMTPSMTATGVRPGKH